MVPGAQCRPTRRLQAEVVKCTRPRSSAGAMAAAGTLVIDLNFPKGPPFPFQDRVGKALSNSVRQMGISDNQDL